MNEDDLRDMELHDSKVISHDSLYVMRVPGGLVYTKYAEHTFNMVFVPLNEKCKGTCNCEK